MSTFFCPICASNMQEIRPDIHTCPTCAARVDQLNLFEDVENEEGENAQTVEI
jgi:hypothetical protein